MTCPETTTQDIHRYYMKKFSITNSSSHETMLNNEKGQGLRTVRCNSPAGQLIRSLLGN